MFTRFYKLLYIYIYVVILYKPRNRYCRKVDPHELRMSWNPCSLSIRGSLYIIYIYSKKAFNRSERLNSWLQIGFLPTAQRHRNALASPAYKTMHGVCYVWPSAYLLCWLGGRRSERYSDTAPVGPMQLSLTQWVVFVQRPVVLPIESAAHLEKTWFGSSLLPTITAIHTLPISHSQRKNMAHQGSRRAFFALAGGR